ncbi:hypothetical protein ACWDSD_01365 [Streptomyces spiralis]
MARVEAAGVTAFAGDGESTAALLNARQGSDFFHGVSHAAAGSDQDQSYTLLGEISAVVTRKKPERHPDVAAYRERVRAWKAKRHGTSWDRTWNGVVSIGPEGTVLAMRKLRSSRTSDGGLRASAPPREACSNRN